MKKLRKAYLGLGVVFALSFAFTTYAECPVTQCGVDCDPGEICQITQYDNGVICSTTMCSNRGPKFT